MPVNYFSLQNLVVSSRIYLAMRKAVQLSARYGRASAVVNNKDGKRFIYVVHQRSAKGGQAFQFFCARTRRNVTAQVLAVLGELV